MAHTGLERSPGHRIYRAYWMAVDWLFPPRCVSCQMIAHRWCPACQEASTETPKIICRRCGQPQYRAGLCKSCRDEVPHFAMARAWAMHAGPLRQALHQFKYKRDLGLGEVFASLLLGVIEAQAWQPDLVVPVPLGRRRRRGYNQAALLARPLAWMLALPYRPQAIVRIRETQSQVGLTSPQRRENVAGAFRSFPGEVVGRQVLLVDDVMTTGATLDACAQALCLAGAQQVYALTVARAGSLLRAV